MKLQIESPVSFTVTPTCASARGCVEDQPQRSSISVAWQSINALRLVPATQPRSETATIDVPLRHRAIVRGRRRRRGFGGPLTCAATS